MRSTRLVAVLAAFALLIMLAPTAAAQGGVPFSCGEDQHPCSLAEWMQERFSFLRYQQIIIKPTLIDNLFIPANIENFKPAEPTDFSVSLSGVPDVVFETKSVTFTVGVSQTSSKSTAGVLTVYFTRGVIDVSSSSPECGGASTRDASTSAITCQLTGVSSSTPSTAAFTMVATKVGETASITAVVATPGSTAGSTGVLFSADEKNTGNNAASASIQTKGESAAITLIKTDDQKPLVAGESGVVSLSLQNIGKADAKDTIVTISTTSDAVLSSTSCTGEGSSLICDFGNIDAGATKSFVVNAKSGTTDIDILAVGKIGDGTKPGETATVQGTIKVLDVQKADLVTSLQGTASLMQGLVGDYTLTVNNKGLGRSADTVVTVTLAGAGKLVSAEGCTVAGSSIVCKIGTLQPSATVTRAIRVEATEGTAFTLTPSANEGSASGAVTTTVLERAADLVFQDLTASKTSVKVNEETTITIRVHNAGPGAIKNGYVDAQIPGGLDLGVDSRGPCVVMGATVRCYLGAIASGATVSVDVTVSSSMPGNYNTSATVASGVKDPVVNNNAKALTVTVTA